VAAAAALDLQSAEHALNWEVEASEEEEGGRGSGDVMGVGGTGRRAHAGGAETAG
jgi:hypothetical protein